MKFMFCDALYEFKRKTDTQKAAKLNIKAVFDAHLSPDKKVAIAPTNKIINNKDTSFSDDYSLKIVF